GDVYELDIGGITAGPGRLRRRSPICAAMRWGLGDGHGPSSWRDGSCTLEAGCSVATGWPMVRGAIAHRQRGIRANLESGRPRLGEEFRFTEAILQFLGDLERDASIAMTGSTA